MDRSDCHLGGSTDLYSGPGVLFYGMMRRLGWRGISYLGLVDSLPNDIGFVTG